MPDELIPIGKNDSLNFSCGPENECFNECCRNLCQAITPYDILRLKKNLGISSQQFLKEYTSLHHGPESGLPVVEFKQNPASGYECPFVAENGCRVYEDRPASCRMYPLARAVAKSRQTGEINEYFALIEESHCKGFCKKTDHKVKDWLDTQGVDLYNRENDKLVELISLKNRIRPGKLEGAQSDMFYLALYNIDEFRDRIFNHSLLGDMKISEDVLNEIENNDPALLNFGIEWVKFVLFGIPTALTNGEPSNKSV